MNILKRKLIMNSNPKPKEQVTVWLASDESDYMNGTTIFVDGRMFLYPGFSTNG